MVAKYVPLPMLRITLLAETTGSIGPFTPFVGTFARSGKRRVVTGDPRSSFVLYNTPREAKGFKK